MKQVILDTLILVDWIRAHRRSRPKSLEQAYNNENAVKLITMLITEDVVTFISCHILKELLQYPNISLQEEERIKTLIPGFCDIPDTDAEVAEIAAKLSRQSAEYRRDHVEDCYIAATAIHYKLPLYTRNPADFKFVPHKDLKIVVPYDFRALGTE